MGRILRLLWGRESLRERLLRVAVISPYAVTGGVLEIVGNSTHNDTLWWVGIIIFVMMCPLGIITLVLVMAIRGRKKAREEKLQVTL